VHVVLRLTRVDSRARWHIADGSTRRSTAVDVLPVAQLMIVIQGVIALRGKKGLQTILSTAVDGQELLTVLAGIIREELRLGSAIRRGGGNIATESYSG